MVEKNQLITDSVHGEIELSTLERDLIRTESFSRLGHIKQLGLAHFVWPGATHTRFSHSLGCMHIVGKIAEHLALDDEEVKLLRLAGLLHDIGQYPLSHVIETVYRHIAGTSAEVYFEDPAALASADKRPLLWRAAGPAPGNEKARDKALAKEVIDRRPDLRAVFDKHGITQEDRNRIASMIAGRHLDTLYGHLLDSDYDCDRFDYVLRDSRAAGVTYGLIELDYLIQNMKTVPVEGGSDRVLAINRRKGLHALEQYLTARYFMYSQVIYHKTVRSLELLAKAAGLAFAERGIMYSSFEEIIDSVSSEDFVLFDDAYFYGKLRSYWHDADEGDALREIVGRLLFRRPLGFVCEYRSLAQPGREPHGFSIPHNWFAVPENLATIADDVGLDPEKLVVEELTVDMVPFGSEVPFELVLRENIAAKRAVFRSPRLLDDDGRVMFLFQDEGSLISDLAGKQLRLLRMYVNSTDSADIDKLRIAIQSRTGVAARA